METLETTVADSTMTDPTSADETSESGEPPPKIPCEPYPESPGPYVSIRMNAGATVLEGELNDETNDEEPEGRQASDHCRFGKDGEPQYLNRNSGWRRVHVPRVNKAGSASSAQRVAPTADAYAGSR